MTKIISVAIVNLVTPKAGAKHELLFNKPAASSHRGYMFLGYAENTNSIDIYGPTLYRSFHGHQGPML
jgi:hypothetical protein